MRPARTRHLPKYSQRFPSSIVYVENTDVVQADVVGLFVNVVVSATVYYEKLGVGASVTKVGHLKLGSRTRWHTSEVFYLRY